MAGTLFVVATPIGNLEDITARALRVLREVSVIAAEDTRRTGHLLARYAIATPTLSLHEHNEAQRLPALIERLRGGQHVAMVSDAGTPTISDPGQRLVRAAIDGGLRVEPVPGPSAVIAALMASGLSGQSFMFAGFPPVRSKDRKTWFGHLTAAAGPVVFFEAPHRIRRTLQEIQTMLGDLQVCVARELTKMHEEFLRGPISMVLQGLKAPVGEITVVLEVGHKTKSEHVEVPSMDAIASEFCRMTETGGSRRRSALKRLADKYGVSTNAVYKAVETHNKSVK